MDRETREFLTALSAALDRAESLNQAILAAEVALAQVLQGEGLPGELARWLREILESGRLPDESELPIRRPGRVRS